MKTPAQCIDVLKDAFRRVFGRAGSYGEIAYAAGVAQLETGCGETLGYHNWGAVTGSYLGQSFSHSDSKPDGHGGTTSYLTKFRSYPSDLDGAADFLRVLYTEKHNGISRDDVRIAASEVRFYDASKLLHATGYYTGTINKTDSSGQHDEKASVAARIEAHAKVVVEVLRKGRFAKLANVDFGPTPPKVVPARPALGCLWRRQLAD